MSNEWILNLHETQLIKAAKKLQMKAAKSDIVFKMVDSFNQNSVHVTVTWKILNTSNRTFSFELLIFSRNEHTKWTTWSFYYQSFLSKYIILCGISWYGV